MFNKLMIKIYFFLSKFIPTNSKLYIIKPSDAFAYFSGYSHGFPNLPMIYACVPLVEDQALIVSGRGFYKEYPLKDLEKAFDTYRLLLLKTGYNFKNITPTAPDQCPPCNESDTEGSERGTGG